MYPKNETNKNQLHRGESSKTSFINTSSFEQMETNKGVKSPINQQGTFMVSSTSSSTAGNRTLISLIN